jgi:DNA-binding NarL/FixJ family response regulator
LKATVLVVDDSALWRRHVSEVLARSPRWQILGEAIDGREAVESARVVRADLILMDVSLPTLSGIEAARRILADQPAAKILFVSGHRTWDIAKAALDTGACGYVVKSCAECELIPAMEAAVEGRRFVSASFPERLRLLVTQGH